MRLVALLLVAGLLTALAPTASAVGDCFAVTHNDDPLVEACDRDEDNCTGVRVGRLFTGYCDEVPQCLYPYVAGKPLDRICWT